MRNIFFIGMLLFTASCGLFEKKDPGEPTPTGPNGTGLTTALEYPEGFQEGSFCTVRSVFEVTCVTGCHSGIVPEGGLDLQTDPFYSLVYKPSVSSPGSTLVVPRYPERSYLYQRMLGVHDPAQGAIMPPQGKLDNYFLIPIRDWILAGAPFDCEPGFVEETYVGNEPNHPPGWEAANVHGKAANLQTGGDCRSCHGADLAGGTAQVSCDSCHVPGWRTDCTYCHGGTLDQTGAPPKDIDGEDNPQYISFTSHQAHIDGDSHYQYGCSQCHYKPTDILTPGHVFEDVTAGYGELDYTGGIAPYGTYYQGTCSNVYCHGNGLVDGQATDGQGPMNCTSCHANQNSNPNDWLQMSGRHYLHLNDAAAACYECHSQVIDANQNIIAPNYHTDGTNQVLPIGVTYLGGTCTGACHDHDHDNDQW